MTTTMVVKAVSSRIGLSVDGQRVEEEINVGRVGRNPCRGTRVGQVRVDGAVMQSVGRGWPTRAKKLSALRRKGGGDGTLH